MRWQIALVFKEWKSYANLHAFKSANPAIVEGLIWASLCAAALQRSRAHVAQRSRATIPISARFVAMCGAHILPRLLRSALTGFRHLEALVHDVLHYLWHNAARAHPQRDRVRGRMRFGLDYVGVTA